MASALNGTFFPPHVAACVNSLLLGVVHFPRILLTLCAVAGAAPIFALIRNTAEQIQLFQRGRQHDKTMSIDSNGTGSATMEQSSGAPQHHSNGIAWFLSLCWRAVATLVDEAVVAVMHVDDRILFAVSLLFIALLLWIRKRPVAGVTTSCWLGTGHQLQQLPNGSFFSLWQCLFALSLSAAMSVVDGAVFPSHAQGTTVHAPDHLGIPMPVVSVWSWLRPLTTIVVALVWLTLLGWWSDPRVYHQVPDVSA